MQAFFRRRDNGLCIIVRVTPRTGSDRLDGVEARGDGKQALHVRVRAAPEKGAANAAMIALVAKAFGVPKSAVAVTAGATARLKTLVITGDPEALDRVAREMARG